MMTTAAPALADTRQIRARALAAAGGALAAALAWVVEVPVLGIHLTFRFGPGRGAVFGPGHAPMFGPGRGLMAATGHVQTIGAGQVIGVSLAAGLLGWLLLAVLERFTPRARVAWTGAAVAAAAASLALPLIAATTTAATLGLISLHLVVAAAVIPALARTARSR